MKNENEEENLTEEVFKAMSASRLKRNKKLFMRVLSVFAI